MKGEAIPGSHWVEVDLQRSEGCVISRAVVDWETAFAKAYHLQGWSRDAGKWVVLASFQDLPPSAVTTSKTKQHVVHKFKVATVEPALEPSSHLVTKVRLAIDKPATQWGVSIWRFQAYGMCDISNFPAHPS